MTTREFNLKYAKAEEKLRSGELDMFQFVEATNILKREYSKSLMEQESITDREDI